MHVDWFLSDLLGKLGISGGFVAIAIVLFIVLYFVIKYAVTNGIGEALKKRDETERKNEKTE